MELENYNPTAELIESLRKEVFSSNFLPEPAPSLSHEHRSETLSKLYEIEKIIMEFLKTAPNISLFLFFYKMQRVFSQSTYMYVYISEMVQQLRSNQRVDLFLYFLHNIPPENEIQNISYFLKRLLKVIEPNREFDVNKCIRYMVNVIYAKN